MYVNRFYSCSPRVYGHLEHCSAIWYIFPALVYRVKKNLATLLCMWTAFTAVSPCFQLNILITASDKPKTNEAKLLGSAKTYRTKLGHRSNQG
jgi:hypothetical protein